jgi:hypothetical protein
MRIAAFRKNSLTETEPVRPFPSPAVLSGNASPGRWGVQLVLASSSLFFVLLQSVCTFFAAIAGLRLLLGVGALASLAAFGAYWDRFHIDSIRLPVMAIALIGSCLSLAGVMRVWSLRHRSASHWRRKAIAPSILWRERGEFALSLITLALIAIEEVAHFHHAHHF